MATEPLAIVGLSCRLPGSANSLATLWDLLADGREAWSPVPAERFNEAAFHHPDSNDPNGTNNHRGGHFIDGDVRDFDHAFFHLSPQQAAAMDPQQRILLEMAYEALESAGSAREVFGGSRTAVYAAIFGTDYERNLGKDVLDLPIYQSVGTGAAILANRISYVFDLRGPSVTLDTGCSGGLVALHQACQSLRNGESDTALVGSANLQLMPDHYIGMANQHMVSSSGRCYPFDIRGEGYGRGEGFVVVVVKRLSDALANRDPIRSIILNSGTNQDGYTASGITHPNRVAQADLIRETYARIGLQPQDVAYVEAHGTGTVAGDNEELAAITQVFAGPDRSVPLYVGSNKGSIGHTESTSGLASLLKAVAMLDCQVIPPVAGFKNPKPGLPLDRICIPTERLPWPSGVKPRISINSFGYGGANAHVILERAPQPIREAPDSETATASRLFILSANNQSSLKSMLEAHADWIEQNSQASLADISYTLCHRRSALPWRFTCVADKSTSLAAGLRQGVRAIPSKPSPSKRDIIFVFSGQGAQWARMSRELLLGITPSTIYRDSIRTSRDILHNLGATWDLETELLRPDGESNINKAELAQPATTAVQIALVTLLRAQGVHPSTVVGHSSGEIAAAYAAGRLSQRAALRIAFHRGFMAAVSKEKGLPRGAMLSVGLGERETAPYLEGLTQGQAVIACINSPSSVTVSGDADAVDEVISRISARNDGIFSRKLLVDTAYHSHHMKAVADDYRTRLEGLILKDDIDPANKGGEDHIEATFVSSVTGLPTSAELGTSYWVDNLVSPVRFSDAIDSIARLHHKRGAGHAIFVEIGPHSAMAGPVRQCLSSPDVPKLGYDYLSVLQRKVDAVSSALTLAGRVFEGGVKLNFNEVSALAPGFHTALVEPNLPPYAWDHSMKHWHESRLNLEYRQRREPYHHLLGVRMIESSEPRWRHMVGLATLPWLADHVIDGLAIFPGAGYVCLAAEAVVQLARELHPGQELEALAFRDVSFLRGLVVPASPQQRVELQLSLKAQPGSRPLTFAFSVTALSDGQWHEQSRGLVEGIMTAKAEADQDILPAQARHLGLDGIKLQVEDLYSEMAAAGNTYGPAFRGLHSIMMAADGRRSEAVVEVPDIAAVMPARHQAQHVMHPATFDSMFHVGIPMIRHLQGAGSVMPVRIGELLVSTKTPALSSPGSKLDVRARLTSSQFRATFIDMTVTTDDGYPILSASDIESRSLATHTAGDEDDSGARGICYELEWHQDLDHLRSSDLPTSQTLSDLMGRICSKNANISVVELGAGHGDLSLSFLRAANAHGGTISTYDFVDTTSELFDEARRRLSGHPIHYHISDPQDNFEPQNLAGNLFDVVLVSNIAFLAQAPKFLRGSGSLVLVLGSGSDQDWDAILRQDCPTLEVQLTFRDAIDGSLVAVARNMQSQAEQPPQRVHIFTHSAEQATPRWVVALEAGLQECGLVVHRQSLDKSVVQSAEDARMPILVVDDLSQPILSDEDCFEAAITLLRQKSRIVWLSLDSPPSMYQITGVARTAHAENEDLRLITVHAASEAVESSTSRFIDLISHWLSQVVDQSGEPHREREFRVNKDGGVLIPRLHYSDRLNRAINAGDDEETGQVEIETCNFVGGAQSLALHSEESSSTGTGDVLFVQDHNAYSSELPDDAVEIETQAFVLSKSDGGHQESVLGEYAGIIKRIGKTVQSFVPGEHILALSLDGVLGANRPQIPASHVCRQPEGLLDQPAVAVGLFLPVIASVHALHHLARLPTEGAVVLVHGALGDVGRATVAVAHSLGARVVATAADKQELLKITQQLHIQAENIIIGRPSLSNPRYRDDGSFQLDAIVQAGQGEDSVPSVAWACLKPFGNVVIFQDNASTSSLATVKNSEIPRNAAIHFCHIADVLRVSPAHTARLLEQAGPALQRLSALVSGFSQVVHDVAQMSEAMRQLKLGISNKVVVQAGPGSLVRVTAPPRVDDAWASADFSYVVAGGLGDLGRRLLLLMARRGAAHLVTLSRRTVNPEDYSNFQAELDRARPGCRLHCLVCDVTCERSVKNAADTLIISGIPPVRGIIQSAVFLQDRTLERMRYEDFRPVTLAKIEGTLALEKYFASDRLDFFLMLSSTVVVTGASGQANYNAGNAVQDALAHARRPGFMTLNIGWIEDAIHTSNDKTRLQGLWRTGLRPIQPHELSRYFDCLLGVASGRSPLRQAVIGFDSESLSHTSAGNSNVQSAMFCHVRNSPAASATTSSKRDVQSFKDVVRDGDTGAIVDFITNAITGQLTTLISVDAAQVNERDGSILELGLDSLVAIELRNWITREFSAPLQSSEIMTDQPIRDLALKVASRSSVVSSKSDGEASSESEELGADSVTTASLDEQAPSPKLPPLPRPALEDTLRQFEESRSAIDSEQDRRITSDAVCAFLEGPGPELYQQMQATDPNEIADAYERQVYLERREPLPEQGPFTFIHPIDAPTHTQARRAATTTIAAIDFARRLAQKEVAPDTLHGQPLSVEGRDWLFWATRRPGLEGDRIERHVSNHTVAVLRRGHVFEMKLPDADQTLQLSAVQEAYDEILSMSGDSAPPVCTLTADERNSWASVRTLFHFPVSCLHLVVLIYLLQHSSVKTLRVILIMLQLWRALILLPLWYVLTTAHHPVLEIASRISY